MIEKEFKTAAVHQAYIEPHACLARWDADGQTEIWCSSQGHFQMRALTAQILGMKIGDIRVYAAEIGGGFGGKTVTYLEPVATLLSKKSGSPVRLMMSRDEVFKATGPTSGSSMWVKMGVTKDGKLVAAEGIFKFQAGAFPGSPVMNGCLCSFAPYDIPNQHTIGYDVVCNRPKSAAYRAPGSPISAFAVESVVDMLATKIGMDPLELRLKNAARIGTPTIYGPKHAHNGFPETIEALLKHPAYKAPLGKNQGRGVASGYWFNGGGDSSATMQINADGTVLVATGSPDIGGSRASMAIMAAETLGVDYNQVRAIVADTGSVGYTHVTGGSRVTFATGTAVVNATKNVIVDLCKRAAMIWDVDPEGVVWEDGFAKPASSNVGDFEPLSLKALAAKSSATGGPISASASVNAGGQAPGFSTQFCDVEVDPETGKVTVLRFVAAQDVGRAIHPSYVEGQIQGGVVQGIGWALNEEYIYNAKGQLDNAGLPGLPLPGGVGPADDRGGPGGGAEPGASVWREGCRRGQHLSADGGDRQRDRARDRPADDRTADVAAARSLPRSTRGRRPDAMSAAPARVVFTSGLLPALHRRRDGVRGRGEEPARDHPGDGPVVPRPGRAPGGGDHRRDRRRDPRDRVFPVGPAGGGGVLHSEDRGWIADRPALRSVRTVIGSYVRGNSFLGPSRVFDTHLGWGFCALHSSVISSGHFAA